jgi:hypothetical protein
MFLHPLQTFQAASVQKVQGLACSGILSAMLRESCREVEVFCRSL